ncbi:MAG: right-handed parallel beta-helix repeat-containing protein [Candidatus Hodarchaeota archaeon]
MKKGRMYAIFLSIILLGVIPSINQDLKHKYNNHISQLQKLPELPNEERGIIEERKEDFIQLNEEPSSTCRIKNYIERSPIVIIGNSDFGPSKYDFPGLGTKSNPYVIEGYNITDSSGKLIYIVNTTAFFVIQDCILDGINRVYPGIEFSNVTSGVISNNTLINNDYSCNIADSDNNIIENNLISMSNHAIRIAWGSGNNSVINNKIQNTGVGITVNPYSNSRIYHNTITEMTSTGISIGSDSSGDIRNNTLSNIGGYGIFSGWATGNVKIVGNYFSNTSLASIALSNTHYGVGIVISNNTIVNSQEQGILFASNDDNVPITRNTIVNCVGYGVELNTNSDNNEITWNNFFHNNGGGTQAYDNGTNNVFEYNHWNDHVGSDTDTDGFVDSGYSIVNGNTDPFPRVAPIWINDNSDFLNFSCSGTGTSNDPYIIEKQYFLSNRTSLIYITNTDAHFEIRNSIFNGLNGSNDLIYLDDVNNGHILDNTITNSANNAIWIKGSSNNNIISENNIHDCGSGIRLIGNGSNNIISENRIYNLVAAHGTGIAVDYEAYSNTITGNTIYGSWTYNNRMHGIIVSQSAKQNVFSVNTIYNCSYNGFYIANSAHHNTYSENNISHCGGYGIFTWMGTHNDTFSNNIIYNTSTGIALDNSSSNTLSGNTIFNCTEGIWVQFSISNHISSNMIYNNTDYGIDLGESSENNTVEWNNILNNNQTGGCQAYDEGIANNIRYNYWDDWTSPDVDGDGFVDDPYNINGNAGNQDLSPRTFFELFKILSPLDQEYGSPPINISFFGHAIHYWYYIEGEDLDNQTWTGDTYRSLPTGTYTLHAYGNNSEGMIFYYFVDFTVETTPPKIDIISPQNTTYYQDWIFLSYSVTDYTSYSVYLGGTSIPAIMNNITIGFTEEDEGSHNLTIVAVDHLGNVARETIIFYIYTPPDLNIISPLNTTYTTGSITISLSGDAIHYWYFIAEVDSANQTWTENVTRSLSAGTFTLHAYGNDSDGVIAHKTVIFIIDIPTSTTTTPTTTTTTIQQTTTTTSKRGSFPSLIIIILCFIPILIIGRKQRRS